jgi:hypothetical protein
MKCQFVNPPSAKFCAECGASLTTSNTGRAFAEDLSKKVADKVQDHLIEQAVKWLFDLGRPFAVFVFGTLFSFATSIVLAIADSAHGMGQWFLLTWPLTIAIAVVVVLLMGPMEDQAGIAKLTVAAAVVFGAMLVGSTFAGQEIQPGDETGGLPPLRYLINALIGFERAYGWASFLLSIFAGALAGYLCISVSKRT